MKLQIVYQKMQLKYHNNSRHRSDIQKLFNNLIVANFRICDLDWLHCGFDKTRQNTCLFIKLHLLERTKNAKRYQQQPDHHLYCCH